MIDPNEPDAPARGGRGVAERLRLLLPTYPVRVILRADHITIEHRPGHPALREVSAVFMPGEVTAVLGPNGAGKSTLLRCLAGVISTSPQRQQGVFLAGILLSVIAPSTLATRLAFLPQREETPTGFTVEEVVGMGSAAGGDPGQTEPALQRLALVPLRRRTVETLSEGQRQRVALARTFAQTCGTLERPGVVLADEPAAALDPALAAEAMGVFREMAGRGRTVVVVLHDADLALRAADRALLLAGGEGGGTVLAQGVAGECLSPGNLETLFGVRWARVLRGDGTHAVIPA
jgi:iron complex transport system ATP-binding protein